MAEFVAGTDAALREVCPGVRNMTFGHLGDGNLHYNLLRPADSSDDAFLACAETLTRLVHDRVHEHGGSFSAEQGIGQLRPPDMRRYKDPVELDLMLRVKKALDPEGRMNPGKILA